MITRDDAEKALDAYMDASDAYCEAVKDALDCAPTSNGYALRSEEAHRLGVESSAARERLLSMVAGVPLTAENVGRAWVVAGPAKDEMVYIFDMFDASTGKEWWRSIFDGVWDREELLAMEGTTVLAWRHA